ncbi:MAG: BMP family ABC transporter substrate-binding protein [Pseudomonadota bacterium]
MHVTRGRLVSRRVLVGSALASLAGSLTYPRTLRAATQLKVGFVLSGSLGDGGRNQRHGAGHDQLLATLGQQIKTSIIENTPVAEAAEAIRQLISWQAQLIFMTDPDFAQATRAFAETYPDIFFEQIGLDWPSFDQLDNVSVFDARLYQGYYVLGSIAGQLSGNQKIGFVASKRGARSMNGVNAFALGVANVSPQSQVIVRWIGEWQDAKLEAELAQSMIKDGCDVLGQQTGSAAPVEVAMRNHIYCFAMGYTYQDTVDNPWLVSSLLVRWGDYYIRRTLDVLRRSWSGMFHWYGLKAGLIEITPYNSVVDGKIINQAEALRVGLVKGERNVFTGPFFDKKGNLIAGEASTLSDAALLETGWLNDNIVTEPVES